MGSMHAWLLDFSASQSQGVLGFDVKITEALVELVRGRSSSRLVGYFNTDPDYLVSRVNLMQVVDAEGFSLLHIAVFKKYSGDVEKALLTQIKETCKDKEKIKDKEVLSTRLALDFVAYFSCSRASSEINEQSHLT